MYNRHEMLDVVVEDGHAVGIITRNMVTGQIDRWAADRITSYNVCYTKLLRIPGLKPVQFINPRYTSPIGYCFSTHIKGETEHGKNSGSFL